ncbi:polysaccharide biosynthesis protein [Spirochaetia bacterium]|nr:polysaccharide biosynthesis protein [Spirochaetia bacterium]
MFNRIIREYALFKHLNKTFNLKYALGTIQFKIIRKLPLLKKNCDIFHHKTILKYLAASFSGIINKFNDNQYPKDNKEAGLIPPIIWLIWWDGIDNMPDIIRACYYSLKKYAGSLEIRLIDKNNVKNYITLPEHINKKFEDKRISLTHLSDILRVSLLAEYGGLYLDATVMVSDTITLNNGNFFTQKGQISTDNVSHGQFAGIINKKISKSDISRWCGFILAEKKNNVFFNYMKDFFYAYWEKYDELIDYFLIDYAIALGYELIPQIRTMLDNVPINNPNLYSLQNNLQCEYSADDYLQFCTNTIFHKLTWKVKYNKYRDDKNLSFFGYIINTLS